MRCAMRARLNRGGLSFILYSFGRHIARAIDIFTHQLRIDVSVVTIETTVAAYNRQVATIDIDGGFRVDSQCSHTHTRELNSDRYGRYSCPHGPGSGLCHRSSPTPAHILSPIAHIYPPVKRSVSPSYSPGRANIACLSR